MTDREYERARSVYLEERARVNKLVLSVEKANPGLKGEALWLEIANAMVDSGMGLHPKDEEKYKSLKRVI